jgi:hypothetical protein
MSFRRCFQRLIAASYLSSTSLLMCCVLAVFTWPQGTKQKETPLEVSTIVDAGSKYSGRLLSVRGCYVRDFEVLVFQPCGIKFNQFSKYSVWLDDIDEVSLRGPGQQPPFLPEESATVLKEGRRNFWKLEATRGHPISVILEGEFQTGAGRQYGHLSFYRSRFIVHKLLWQDGPESVPKR